MPEPEIRPFRPADAERTLPLFRRLIPGKIHTEAAILHFVEAQPARAELRAWTALVDDEVVGWANVRLRWFTAAEDVGGWIGVLPGHRGLGIGSALLQLIEEHGRSLGARHIASFAFEDDADGRRFASKRGYREGRREQYWALDVATAAVRNDPTPVGAEVVALASVREREHELFDLFASAHSDMPGDETWTIEFDEWLLEAWGAPTLDHDASAVVLVDGRPASFAWINTDRDGGLGENEMTGTHRDFRRRGLARLAKEASIRWAADLGIHTLYTSNETTNADMLALNEHLGYRPTHVLIELRKDLD